MPTQSVFLVCATRGLQNTFFSAPRLINVLNKKNCFCNCYLRERSGIMLLFFKSSSVSFAASFLFPAQLFLQLTFLRNLLKIFVINFANSSTTVDGHLNTCLLAGIIPSHRHYVGMCGIWHVGAVVLSKVPHCHNLPGFNHQ